MLLLAGIVYPLLLAALSGGLGLGLERVARVNLPGSLVVPLGFAALICVTQLGTVPSATAKLTLPIVIALAAAGLFAGRGRLRWRVGAAYPTAAVVGVYLVLAAPVLLTGQPNFTGYGVDSTPAFHWLGADHLATHGRGFSDVHESAATEIDAAYFDKAYPSGGNTVLGVTARAVGVDVAWLWQFMLAFAGSMLALALYGLLASVTRARWHAAAIAFIAAQPALVYAFYLQGQVKELLATMLLALLAATLWLFATDVRRGPRSTLTLAVVGAAGTAATGVGFALWLAPAALVALAFTIRAFWRTERVVVVRYAASFVVAFVVLAAPALGGIPTYLSSVSNLLNKEPPLGSLLQPLSPFQVGGIWPAGDYRLPPASHLGVTFWLLGLVGLGALIAVEWLVRTRAWSMLAYAAVVLPGCVILAVRGTPWVDAKAMAVAAPVVVALGLLMATALEGTTARWAARLAAAAIAVGVLWSNAVMYHNTQLGPSKRYRELASIGRRFAGDGPTLRPDFDDYSLHFLAGMRPQGPGDARPPVPPVLTGGATPGYGVSFRMDQLAPQYVSQFKTIVLQRSAFESRPPAIFRRVWVGHYYEVWQRGPGAVLEHVPAGDRWTASGVVRCSTVRDAARLARSRDARLAVAERPPTEILQLARQPHGAAWFADPNDPDVLIVHGPGHVGGTISVPAAGSYVLWLAGSFTRPVVVTVDGRRVARLANDIKYSGLAQAAATIHLDAGRHRVEVLRGGGTLAPGNGAGGSLGPVALTPASGSPPVVRSVDEKRYREACGRPVDWIEVVDGVPNVGG